MTPIFTIIAIVAAAFGLYMELRRDLMMLQQNSYRAERYMLWLNKSADTTSAMRLCGYIVLFMSLIPTIPAKVGAVLIAAFGIFAGVSLLRKKYKKPLVMTKRALRIFVTALIVSILTCTAAVLLFPSNWLYTIAVTLTLCFGISHMIILVANGILSPVEKHITRKYYNDAKSILRSMPDLKIIGVTGSYGKTTTKHYLQRILSEQFETLMTPGSFNTTMGVVRTVREYLKPYHEIFIVEMGAKQKNDIKEICDLVRPHSGVITAVGPQHLESFKTIENVQATKFELADALPSNGIAVINNDFEMIANRPVSNARTIRYGVKNLQGANYIATDIKYTPNGTEFTVVDVENDHRLTLHTHLVGECNISNLLAAVAIARTLGVSDQRIAYAVEQIEQVEHRLSIKRVPGGPVIIDDAFNSNPVGSAMALDVLGAMKTGKRILVTPGMIELGDKQFELNREFGRKAASCCDIAIVVGQYNRDAILEGLKEGGMPEKDVHAVDSFADAQHTLRTLTAPGDAILYENDLPDTFK